MIHAMMKRFGDNSQQLKDVIFFSKKLSIIDDWLGYKYASDL